MPRVRHVLHKQCQHMVLGVHKFMKKEVEVGVIDNLKAIRKRTSIATGVSLMTVRRVLKNAISQTSNRAFHTPGKKRLGKKKVTGVNTLDRGILRRLVHNFHITQKELPTTRKLVRKLKQNIKFEGSDTSLGRLLKELGFSWKRTEDKRQILIEHSSIRLRRIEYLKNITKYREEGRPIIYTGEIYVYFNNMNSIFWSNNAMEALKANKSKRQGIIIIYAASDEGFIPNTMFVLKHTPENNDYNSIFSYDIYKKWIGTHLLPNLLNNSIVVIGNCPYHIKLEDELPTPKSTKLEMESWLSEKRIPFCSNMLKPQLYKLICLHKGNFKTYCIDHILEENKHSLLHLPLCHEDLNPIEMIWTDVKSYVTLKKATYNTFMNILDEKLYALSKNEWSSSFENVKKIEEEYISSDIVIDKLTDDIAVCDVSSDSEFDVDDTDEQSDSSDSMIDDTDDDISDENDVSSNIETI